MKGITIGEIGNKVGFNTVNNGFLGFNHVRIPLNQMLMKNAKVLENGDYVKEKSSILTYGTMTFVRVSIVRDMGIWLIKAATIATRYSAVRRQSPIDPDKPEPKIMEHVTQQMKIFPAIAKIFALRAAAENLTNMHLQVTEEISKGNLERLPELHALSCCLKAVSTNETAHTVEICRLACGGHGYLTASGLNDVYKMATAAQTYEGENTVLLLQTARYLLKSWGHALAGKKLTPSVEYLSKFLNRTGEREFFDYSVFGILRALQSTAAGKVALAYKHVEERKAFCSPEEAVNQTGIELTKAAELHCQVFFLESAIKMFKAHKGVSPALAAVFSDVVELYAVDLALRMMGNLLQVSRLSFKISTNKNLQLFTVYRHHFR